MGPTEGEVTTGVAGAALKDLAEGTGAVEVAVEALQCSMALRWMQRAAFPWLLVIAAVKTSAIIQLVLNVWSMKMDLKDKDGVPHTEGATPEVAALIVAEATAPATLRRHKLSSHLQKPASQVS